MKCIHPVVDVMNYVMLELGQPLHAFDANKIDDHIVIRFAKNDEVIQLLDNTEVKLKSDVLVIADQEKALAMAGIMGGLSSSVTAETRDIFIESAHFIPQVITGRARQYQLSTDASHRFERGVDLQLPALALQRATELIIEILGGEIAQPSACITALSAPTHITLRYERLLKISGLNASQLSPEEVEKLLTRMNLLQCERKNTELNTVWSITPPTHRFDIKIEEDIIEEICRLYGYTNIVHLPGVRPQASLFIAHANSEEMHRQKKLYDILHLCAAEGYQEVITYGFVNKEQQQILHPDVTALELLNPIAQDMSVMRVSLWPGLINTALYNRARQQERIKLCELGAIYSSLTEKLHTLHLGGIFLEIIWPEQWGQRGRPCDFFDIKSDVETILSQLLPLGDSIYQVNPKMDALHPHQSAIIYEGRNHQQIGMVGMLHPKIQQVFDIKESVGLFSFDSDKILTLANTKESICNHCRSILGSVEIWHYWWM